MVLGLCRLLLRDPVEAEDAAQQTFLSAHRSLLNGAGPRDPAPWLAAIARNECWGRIRARGREPAGVREPLSEQPDPLAEAVRNADLRALWRALGELPRRQRRAFLLRELSGLSYGELAQALAVSEPAVESLLFRARRHVRTRLAAAARALGWPVPVVAKIVFGGAGAASVVAAGAVTVGHDRPPPPTPPADFAAQAEPSRTSTTPESASNTVQLVRVSRRDARAGASNTVLLAPGSHAQSVRPERARPEARRERHEVEPAEQAEPQNVETPQPEEAQQPEATPERQPAEEGGQQVESRSGDGGSSGPSGDSSRSTGDSSGSSGDSNDASGDG